MKLKIFLVNSQRVANYLALTVSDESYSRSVLCTLNIDIYVFIYMKLKILK